MIDGLFERALPVGLLVGLGALIGAAFPNETRATARRAMLTGFQAADWLQGVGAEAFEKGQDVFAEARLEYEQLVHEAQREAERGRLRVVHPTPRRGAGGARRRTRRTASSRTASSTSQA